MRIKPVHLVATMLAIATLYFYQDPNWNGNSRLDATRAIVEEGSFRIDNYQAQPGWDTLDKSVYEGHYYTDKGIGSTLFAVPPYFILYKIATLLGITLGSDFVKHVLTALIQGSAFTALGIVLYLIARQLSGQPWKAALAALAVSLGTMLWPYSVVYYGHVPAALFGITGFYLMLRARTPAETMSIKPFFWTGMLMGLAFITEYPTALIILGLAGYALYVLWGKPMRTLLRAGIAGAAGAAPPLAVMLLYDRAVYGSFTRFSYSHVAVPGFQAGLEQGFMGISMPDPAALYHFTFDPRFGIFWQSPVLLLAFVGFAMAFLRKSWRAETLLAAYCILSIFLMNAGYFMWWGGAAFAARYVMPAMPFFIVPLALIPARLTGILGALTAFSAAQMMIPLLGGIQINVSFHKPTQQFMVITPFNGFSIMYQYGVPLIYTLARIGDLPWSLGTAFGLPFQVSAGLLVAIEAVLGRVLYEASQANTPAPGAAIPQD